jgi:hypothetical protein
MTAIHALETRSLAGLVHIEATGLDALGMAGRAAGAAEIWRVWLPRGQPVKDLLEQSYVPAVIDAHLSPSGEVALDAGLPQLPAGRGRLAAQAKLVADCRETVAVQLENATRDLEGVDGFDGRGRREAVRQEAGFAFPRIEAIYVVPDQNVGIAEHKAI